MEEADLLVGGNSSMVSRVGDRIHRGAGAWTPTIHKLLDQLRENGITEVPEAFGLDDQGREVLSYIDGVVANYPVPEWLWSDGILREAFSLMRRIHDAVSTEDFIDGVWQNKAHEPQQIICHNDFAPYNMVFKDGHVVGLIDFDTASPGSRIWDFSYLAYRLVPFGEDAGLSAPSTDTERLNRLKQATKSYGTEFSIKEIFETMVIRLNDLADYSDNRSKETGQKELAEHAAMYRRDADRIRKIQ